MSTAITAVIHLAMGSAQTPSQISPWLWTTGLCKLPLQKKTKQKKISSYGFGGKDWDTPLDISFFNYGETTSQLFQNTKEFHLSEAQLGTIFEKLSLPGWLLLHILMKQQLSFFYCKTLAVFLCS